MIAKYSGTCKVTGQKIVAGQTNLDSDLYRRSFGEVPSTSLADYPELGNIKIKWYKK